MKLNLAQLACDTFDLRTTEGPELILKLEKVEDGCGDLEFQKDLTILSGLAIRQLLATMEFPIPGGRIYSEQAATISHLSCEGRIRNGFAGEVRSSIAESQSMCLEMEGAQGKGHIIAEGLFVKLDGRGGRVEVGTLTLKDVQCTVGPFLMRLGVFTFHGLKVSWGQGRPQIEALRAHARNLDFHYQGLAVHVSAIDLSEGLHIDESVNIGQVHVGAVEVEVSDFSVKKEANTESDDLGKEDNASKTAKKSSKTSLLEMDLSVFDTVNGNIDTDLTLSVTLPVIGKRVATHHFRIPIQGGIVNYLDFERGLSDLEDAFINIRVRGDRLVLERDIPLIPGLQKPILSWALEPGEVELANQHFVRLGRLRHVEIAGAKNKEKTDSVEEEDVSKKSKIRLHRLDFDNIAIHLSLDETAILKSGEGSLRGHIDQLDLQGCIRHDPDPDDIVEGTTIVGRAAGLGTVAKDLNVFGHLLSGNFSLGSVEKFELQLDELRPAHLKVDLKNINLSRIFFDLARAEEG